MELSQLAGAPFTYPGVGGTADGSAPAGFHRARVTSLIGTSPGAFDRAVEALMTWRMHADFGLPLQATAGRAGEGVETLGRLGIGPLGLDIPCRVVWALEGPGRAGFAYGTLPGHPEAGEEAFLLEDVDGTVRFTISAFSRGARWYSRAVPPLTRGLQRVALRRYAATLRRLAEG
ncbi:DUF1990 family protein [Oryzihumus leptocrescens]|uniref:Uncharacterized protein (UPF0548 family) n=1 Tax=Oryzihumus leptocrescens TaxID=297536 RepID=A0A542ZLR7_9MICO|nr:DUF1990 domain-containing protein [Oryzihumus leptocrescens]TQL61130.1 uncharacterized protein (UPF0548 family) [Oryzihumus leptocrescens]